MNAAERRLITYTAAALALLGFCIGLYHPAGLSLMAQGVRQRGLALGFHGVSGNVGQALAPALAVGLAIAVDWRLAVFVLAGVSAVMAAPRAPGRGALSVPGLILPGFVSGGFLVVAASVFIFFYFMNQPVFTGLIADYAPAGGGGRSYGFSVFARVG